MIHVNPRHTLIISERKKKEILRCNGLQRWKPEAPGDEPPLLT